MNICQCIQAKMKTGVGPKVILPDELVEKILALVPFPFVFKARLLSKSWLARFSTISSEDNEEKKHDIAVFQEQVGRLSSTRWQTFCPVYLGKDNSIGYDKTSHQWQRLPSLSFLPDTLCITPGCWRLAGALLLITADKSLSNLYVANMLTRSWKHLPRPPIYDGDPSLAAETKPADMWLIHTSLETYKVVVFLHIDGRRFSLAQVYDSKQGSWGRVHHFVAKEGRFSRLCNWAFLNGNFYQFIVNNLVHRNIGRKARIRFFLTFNLEEEKFTLLQILSEGIPLNMPTMRVRGRLVVCKSRLMSFVAENFGELVDVFKFDMESTSWSEVTQGSRAVHPACDGDSLFLAYMGHDGTDWSSVPLLQGFRPELRDPRTDPEGLHSTQDESNWEDSSFLSFQPGLNPFVAV